MDFAIPSSTQKQICRGQPDSFIQNAKNLYIGRQFSDIVFEVEGEEIPAHKAILAYRCDYFMKMFTSNWRLHNFGWLNSLIGGMSESHSAKVSIPNMKSHIFKGIILRIDRF